jgi:serine protease Do
MAAWLAAAAGAYGWSPSPAAEMQVFVSPSTGGSYLGVSLADIDAERAKTLSLKEVHGVEITRVQDGSPAATAGVKTGDVVLQYNGQRVEGAAQFRRMVRETPAGREVRLLISRGGAQQTITVKTGTPTSGWDRSVELLKPNMPDFDFREFGIPDLGARSIIIGGSRLGIEGHAVSGQLGDYFGVKQGLLVSSVQQGSAAERAGIRAGDVIVRVDGQAIANQGDVRSALRSAASASKRSVPVVVSRDKRELTVTVTLDEPARGEQVRVRPLLRRGRTALI